MTRTKVLLGYITVACLLVGPSLILAKPFLTGEEWTYREKSLSLIDETTALLTQYLKSSQDYDSWSKIIDSQAHRLSPPAGYQGFHEQLIKGIHMTYDLVFYGSTNETEVNAALDEIDYARTMMPNATAPKPVDLSTPGKIITLVGAMGLVVLPSQSLMMVVASLILAVTFAVCNFLDWTAASAITHIPCDWNTFFIVTSRTILPNFSIVVFLAAMVIVGCCSSSRFVKKVGLTGFVLLWLAATVFFLFLNYWDFNSLLQVYYMGPYNYQLLIQYGSESFVNLSLIAFLVTVASNLYLVRDKLPEQTKK